MRAIWHPERMSKLVLLLPAWNHCVASTVIANGTLSLWAARGDRPGDLGTSATDAAKAHFEWPGTSLPVAALSRQFDVGDAQGSAWMRADPSYIRADQVTARMLACGNLGLNAAECASIASDLKPIFGDAGFEFDACGSERWYLRASVDSQLPQCADPELAIGDDLKLHLPHGPAGRRWRQLFNETQIVLHNHHVNAARARRGAVSVNGLWFWGAGVLPPYVRSRIHVLHSDRPDLRALATLAGITSRALDAGYRDEALDAATTDQSLLFDLHEVRDRILEEDWLAPFDRALRGRRLVEILVQFACGKRLVVRRSHRWRWWRSVSGLRT